MISVKMVIWSAPLFARADTLLAERDREIRGWWIGGLFLGSRPQRIRRSQTAGGRPNRLVHVRKRATAMPPRHASRANHALGLFCLKRPAGCRRQAIPWDRRQHRRYRAGAEISSGLSPPVRGHLNGEVPIWIFERRRQLEDPCRDGLLAAAARDIGLDAVIVLARQLCWITLMSPHDTQGATRLAP